MEKVTTFSRNTEGGAYLLRGRVGDGTWVGMVVKSDSVLHLQEGGRAAARSAQGPAAAGGRAGVSVGRPGSANQRRDPVGTGPAGGGGLCPAQPRRGASSEKPDRAGVSDARIMCQHLHFKYTKIQVRRSALVCPRPHG